MEIFKSKQNKKSKIFYEKEKELFLHLLKETDDMSKKKIQNTYIANLKNTINNGLIMLDKTEIINEKNKIIRSNISNKNYNTSKKNSINNLKIISLLKNVENFGNNFLIQKNMTTIPNANKNLKNFIEEKHKIQKKLFLFNNRNNRKIQSCYSYGEKNKNKKYFNSDYFEVIKKFNISSQFNKPKKLRKNPTYSIDDYKKNLKQHKRNNYKSNNSLKSPRALILKIKDKSFLSSSPKESKAKHNIFKGIEKRVKHEINSTIFKFDRKKLKLYSIKKIKKTFQKLSENKINNKNKNSMKEYFNIKKIFEDTMKKKKKNVNEFKRKSLSYKRILNKKNKFYKSTIKKYFSGPNREMKAELSKYIKNRHFIIDEDNNPYKFRVFNSLPDF